MKNCNTTFIEKQQKYQHYHQAEKYYLLIKVERQNKFIYSLLAKAFENQAKTIEEQGKSKFRLYKS